MKKLILYSIAAVFFLFITLWYIDAAMSTNKINKYFFSEKDREFRVPNNYILVKDTDGNYAIQDNSSYKDRYLTINVYEVGIYFKSTIYPVTFKDSCRIKGLLKRYLSELSSHSEDSLFKPVK